MTAGSGRTGAIKRHSMLRALVLAARHNGVHLSFQQIVRAHGLPEGEHAPADVVGIAVENGLRARAVTLGWDRLMCLGDAFPAIMVLRDGTALVAVGANRSASPSVVLVRDPDDGVLRALDAVAAADMWDGVLVLVKPAAARTEGEGAFGLGWLWGRVMLEQRLVRDTGIAALMLSLFAMAPPFLYLLIVDRVLVHQRMSTLFVLAVGAGFIIVFGTAFGYLRRLIAAELTARIDARLMDHVFRRLIDLPIEVFETVPTGVVTHKLNEMWRIRDFLTGRLFSAVLDLLTLVLLLPLLFVLDAGLTVYVLGVAALMFLAVVAYVRSVNAAHGRVVRAEQRKNSFLVETIHGMRAVKSLALEPLKRRQWDRHAAAAVAAHRDMQLLLNQLQTIQQPLEKLVYIGVLIIGCRAVIDGAGSAAVGSLVAFAMLASRATQPIVQLAGLIQQYAEVRGAVAQVASIVNVPAEDRRSGTGLRPVLKGGIVFEEVRFQYPGTLGHALDRVSFAIPPGSIVGVMGRSGSGKTTVTRLLQGLHPAYEGLIKLDGVELRQMDLGHLRANMGVVLQESLLFSGTVRENIGIARPEAGLEDIIRAARLAGAQEFIERLPQGYDTPLAERAANLSGGQQQRIAIARALLVDPPILILDEATSALDPDSEAIVNANLRRIARGRTVVVISHRLASLVACDRILVMEAGRILDSGTHAELLGRCQTYRHLWFQQNRHIIDMGQANDRTVAGRTTPR